MVRDTVTFNVVDEIVLLLTERDKMVEAISRSEVISESDAQVIDRTREETAETIVRLLMDKVPERSSYYHMHLHDAKQALANRWPELLVNAAENIATSPFTTTSDLRELKQLLEEEQ